MMSTRSTLAALTGLALMAGTAMAQPATPPTRVRGTIEKVDGNVVTIKPRSGAEITVHLTDDVRVTGVQKAQLSDVKPGSYIGTASALQPDGTQKALEVTVFPPPMAGAGEGSYPWDLGSNSTMTNGTIGDLVVSNGRVITVKYKGEERKITVPDDVPIVMLNPAADKSLIKAGAHVIVSPTKGADGMLSANRINIGENGTVPPM